MSKPEIMRGLLLWPAIFVLGGCTMLGPDFTAPDAPVAAAWSDFDDEKIATGSADLAQWWTALNDPILGSLVDAAVAQNLPLQIAAIRIFEARAQLGIAVGNQYPQFQQARGGLAHSELSENAANTPASLDMSYRDVDIGFDAGWELDIWGRFRRGIEAADANLMAEVAGYDDALVSLTAEVANVYIAIRTFEALLEISRQNVAIQERSLEIATVRFKNGVTTALDVEQARTLLANTQASIPSLEIGVRQAENALSILLGQPPGQLVDLENGTGVIPQAPAQIAVGMPADLLRRRPDIRRAELQAAAQSALIGVAEADLYPQFSLTGSVGLVSSDTGVSDLGDLFDGGSLHAGFGPSFSWNILNYGRIKNAVRVEDARFQQTIANYQNTVLQAAREVEDAAIAFSRNEERLIYLKQSVDAAERSVNLALVQYRDGAADFTRVLDTQISLLTQQENTTATQGQVIRDLIATYKALGGAWQIRAHGEVLPTAVRDDMDSRTDWGGLLDSGTPETAPAPASGIRKPDW